MYCSLVMAKARVAPTKLTSIPRLELSAAVTATRLSILLKSELDMKIDEEFFWTDSQVALVYINNDARRFHVFVANRVQLIWENTSPSQWHYVDTGENSADHASRGLIASWIVNKLAVRSWIPVEGKGSWRTYTLNWYLGWRPWSQNLSDLCHKNQWSYRYSQPSVKIFIVDHLGEVCGKN